MNITIREAKIEDALTIRDLNAEALGYEYSLEETYQKLQAALSNSSMKIYIAVYNDQVVGYVHAQNYDVLYAPHAKDILGLAVADDARRIGVGKELMKTVENWAKETGADCVRLVSGAQRLNAHKFYEACGYAGSKEQINFKKQMNAERSL